MSVDTTFRPLTPTYAVDSTAAVQLKEAQQAGVTNFRIRNLNAALIYVTWGQSTSITAVAPAVGTPKANTLSVATGGVIYLELPATTFFVASLAAPALEITGGQGGMSG